MDTPVFASRWWRVLPLCAAAMLAACSGSTEPAGNETANNATPEPTPSAPAAAANLPLGSGVEQANFDLNVAPGADFYRYVNGTWLANTPIPADKSNYGAFTQLDDEAQEHLRTLIEEAAGADAPLGSDEQKVGDFFESFMDEAAIEQRGASPLADRLADIAAAADKPALLTLSGMLNRIGVQIPAGIYINNDEKQSDQYITYITQSGLGLPDRDWYLSTDNASHQQAREAYADYIDKVMMLAGQQGDFSRAVLDIETRLAQAHWDRVQNRQAELTYNKRTRDELGTMAPQLDWAALLGALGVDDTTFIVNQPSFIEAYGQLWEEVPLGTWKDYFSFKLVDAFASYLSDAFVQAQFDFEGRVLNGAESIEPRWKRGVSAVDGALGEVVGRLYVEQYFQEESKERMDELVDNLLAAFRTGIDALEWMTPETKAKAQEKLAKIHAKIGYPDTWKDYSALTVDSGDLVGNVMRSRQVEHEREVHKLGQPIDRGEWFMTPYTVNAYYNPPMNEVVFPAAILQPPFFNVEADDAVNYGGIGAVIGHELSHGFDDQGRKYDGDGNLSDWWTEADAVAFGERALKLAAQYSQIEVLPGKFLNGEFTLGENIGDLSGLAVAYRAYKMSLNGEEAPVIDGFTGDQRFFIGWAQVWRRLYRPENLEVRLTSDPHSHSEARTNAILRNFDAWYEAFNIQPGDAMYLAPEDRVKIW
ncbi:MAG TPA: M13 family metallopeptidase [Hyphomicrobiales bacterium]|nr:M13 family metallopeptidase [Hyphomicrobiales bacterium]